MPQNNFGNPRLRTAVRLALTGGSFAASIGAVQAQQATPPATADNAITEVVVTGSRISVPNQVSISPVTFVGSDAIQQSGVTRVEDLLNQLPQVFADQSSTVSNGSDGTADINLRGLNAKRTLVLVNGLRLGPGDPTTGGQSDINMIPVEMIDSVEILTGGASSTYGADAVAGVVNFKLNDHFEGVKLVADAGLYQHSNDDPESVKEAIAGNGYPEAPNSVDTGAQKSLAFIAGLNSADGNGNATVFATYRRSAAVLESKYSYSACTLGSGYLAGSYASGGKFTCSGSGTSYPGLFVTGAGDEVTIGKGGTVVPFTSANLYNYGALNYFSRPDERYNAGAFLHYEFNEHATVYSQTMFMDDKSVAQIAPSGDFNNVSTFNCANPFLSASELTAFCGGSTAGMSTTEVIARRDVEGGNRASDLEHMDFHQVIGVKGKIDDVWEYDASWQYSLVNLTTSVENYFDSTKIANALNVVSVGGVPTCVVGPPCVPWNIFQPGGVTPAALNYLYTVGIETGRISQTTVDANVTGDLGKYGIQLPTAKSGLKVNFGVEYRDTIDATNPDAETQSGNLAGSGGPVPPTSGGVISREAFFESSMPLLEDLPGAQLLSFDTGYRYSKYNLGFDTNTYKFGVEWSPVEEIRVRGSFSRAVRAPNVVELYAPASVGLDGSISADPCAGANPQFSLAQCERTGVTAAQYGHILANPAGQYNGLLGGNSGLKPETALTASYGIGWTPSYVPHLRIQVDYYDIKIENVIQNIGAGNILTQCGDNDVLCSEIHRDANGSLWLTNNGYITDTLLNVGDLEERGIDLDASYAYDLGSFGSLHTNINGTYIDKYEVTPIAANPGTAYNCVGYYGPTCSSSVTGAGTPVFHWRNRISTTWLTPWHGADLTLTWRFMSSVKLETLSPNVNLAAPAGNTIANGGISNTDAYLSSRNYIDLTGSIKLAEKVTLRLGVQNLFDKDPPLVGTTNLPGPPAGNGNTFPGTYDSLGRYIFGQVIAQF
jgi:outer membrane receptor protein involved in Fe transport